MRVAMFQISGSLNVFSKMLVLLISYITQPRNSAAGMGKITMNKSGAPTLSEQNVIRLQEKLKFNLVHFSSSEVYGDFEDVMKEEVMDSVEIKQLNDYVF